jgi:hypothetical protein
LTDFRNMIDTEGLTPEEEARLRRVHELLVQAGPPPELSPTLQKPPTEPREAEIVQFPLPVRRRVGAWAAIAVAAAAAVFAGGFAIGHSKAKPAAFHTVRLVPMHGIDHSRAAIKLGKPDAVGNWPMLVSIVNLPRQAQRGAYYELWVTRNGKPIAPCGGFRVHGTTTTVRLSVPYRLKDFDGWVVTEFLPGQSEPGRVVMST